MRLLLRWHRFSHLYCLTLIPCPPHGVEMGNREAGEGGREEREGREEAPRAGPLTTTLAGVVTVVAAVVGEAVDVREVRRAAARDLERKDPNPNTNLVMSAALRPEIFSPF